MTGQSGRPKDMSNVELISLDDCVIRMQKELGSEKPPFARGTLKNKFCSGELTRYGTFRMPLVDWKEAKRLLRWKKGTAS